MSAQGTEARTTLPAARHVLAHAGASSSLAIYGATVVLFIAGHWIVGPGFTSLGNVWAMTVTASFIAIAAAGQGLVVLSGGIDLSIPAVITVGGVATTWLTFGSDSKLAWALPIILLFGAGIGVVNGLGVAILGISPVVMTIATNGIVFGVLLVLTGGTPPGSTPGILVDVMHRTAASIPIVVFILAGFAILVSLLMSQTTFGKRVYAIGNSVQVARLSGVRIPSVTTAVYAVSGITASFTGVLLTGYAGASYLTMGDRYLLVSIAAVVVGGASIIGGRGHYLGTLGGALFLTLLASVLQSFTSAESVRQIVFGCIILVAVIAVRERREVM